MFSPTIRRKDPVQIEFSLIVSREADCQGRRSVGFAPMGSGLSRCQGEGDLSAAGRVQIVCH